MADPTSPRNDGFEAPLFGNRFVVEFTREPIAARGGGSDDRSSEPLCQGAFAEVSGLEAAMEPKTIKEGGANYGAHQRAGQRTVPFRQRQRAQLQMQVRIQRSFGHHEVQCGHIAVVRTARWRHAVGQPQVAVGFGRVIVRRWRRLARIHLVGFLRSVVNVCRGHVLWTFPIAFVRGVLVLVLGFKERVAPQHIAHHRAEVQRRHLQQAHRVLQAG